MTNKHRGEVAFKLTTADGDAIEFTARPTFALMAEMENVGSGSIMQMVARCRAGSLSFTDTVRIAALAAQHADKKPAGHDKDDFNERLFSCGPLNLFPLVRDLIGEIMVTGEPEKKGEGAPLTE